MILPDVENVSIDFYLECDFYDLTYAVLGQPKPNIVLYGGLRPPLVYQNELNHFE